MKNVLVIDNYDSFTYNLVHYLEDLDCKVTVVRNDKLELDDANDGRQYATVVHDESGHDDAITEHGVEPVRLAAAAAAVESIHDKSLDDASAAT